MPDSRDTHARSSFRLLTLGGLSLADAKGAVVGQQRRRLALLALLAAARDLGMSRDRLVAFLSPESPTDSARHALQQLVYYLRQQIGDDAFLGMDPLRLNPAVVSSDVSQFETALERGDLEEAVALYRGPYLDGFHLDSREFEEWVAGERSRLAALYRDALFRLARQADTVGDNAAAIERWRQLAILDPLSGRIALALMRSLVAAGDRPAALRHAQVYEALVRAELGVDADPDVVAFSQLLRAGGPDVPAAALTTREPVTPNGGAPEVAPGAARQRQRDARRSSRLRHVRALALYGGAALTVTAMVWWTVDFSASRATPGRGKLTTNVQALNLYKEGQARLQGYTEDDIRQSIYLLNAAVARDSQFALAWLGLARAYTRLGIVHGSMDPREAFPLVKRAAERALTLDNGLAEAHRVLGEYESNFGWNWAEGERHLREAVRLDPYAHTPKVALAYHLAILGRYDEIRVLDAQAISMAPRNPMVLGSAGLHLMLVGHFQEALPFLERAREIAPNLHPVLLVIGDLYTDLGDSKRAVEYLQRADSIAGHQVITRGVLGYAHALAGDTAAPRAILRELKRGAASARSPAKTATAIANVYIGLGDRDSAFAWLDIAYQQRSADVVFLLRTHARRLAPDARYTALLERVGLRLRAFSSGQSSRIHRGRS